MAEFAGLLLASLLLTLGIMGAIAMICRGCAEDLDVGDG